MDFKLTKPCTDCPFRAKFAHAFSLSRLEEFASGAFHCHKTGEQDAESGSYIPNDRSVQCAGALIFLEKRKRPNQWMRICERLGAYDRTKLDMDADVR